MASLTDLKTVLEIIGGIFTIIGGIYASFKTEIGKRFWFAIGREFRAFGRFYRRHWKKLTLLGLLLVALLVAYYFLHTRTVTGTIYYVPCGAGSGLDPVQYVTVSLSDHPDLKSAPTGPDGKFTILGIPRGIKVEYLTARFGDQDYAPMAYKSTNDYPIIARPSPCSTIRDVHEIITPWLEISGDGCQSDDGRQFSYVKRFVLEDTLTGAQNQHEAILTVERLGGDNLEMMNAFVILPTVAENLYRNAMQGVDNRKAHRWIFLSPSGRRIKLEVCLGSNDNSAVISQTNLHAFYELH